MNQTQVLEAWLNGQKGKASALSTDGTVLWSYQLPIGVTLHDGEKGVLPFKGHSSTTTGHGYSAIHAIEARKRANATKEG